MSVCDFREATGVVLHKDSKWFQQWKDFKDNNVVFNSKSLMCSLCYYWAHSCLGGNVESSASCAIVCSADGAVASAELVGSCISDAVLDESCLLSGVSYFCLMRPINEALQ